MDPETYSFDVTMCRVEEAETSVEEEAREALRAVLDVVWHGMSRPSPPHDSDPDVIRAALSGERLARTMCRESVEFFRERLNMQADANRTMREERDVARLALEALQADVES